jgi:hypothetical protein
MIDRYSDPLVQLLAREGNEDEADVLESEHEAEQHRTHPYGSSDNSTYQFVSNFI